MPTPSPNQPLDSTNPQTISTCPEESQNSLRSGRQLHHTTPPEREGVPIEGNLPSHGASAGASAGELDATAVQPAEDDSILQETHLSMGLSSRSTTVSPQPQSSATDMTSPSPSRSAGDSVKIPEISPSQEHVRDVASQIQGLNATSTSDRDTSDGTVYQDDCSSPSLGPEFATKRIIPVSPSSYLRPGSRFHGTQQSERQVYDVQVEIKHVDMSESFLCGYLRIQGLTADHPTLTTYFEGEIIGTKYTFFTQHEDWGANAKVDLNHWGKFSAFRPYQKHARKGPITIPDIAQRENIFMRWKEHFLVPDHRVRTITGASFEGFYYICFNQVKGEVSGIYFHSKSEKFQQLELKHVPDRGCFSAMELR